MLIFGAAVLSGALLLCPQKKNEPSNTVTDLATDVTADLVISSVADLQAFATNVNNGTTYAGLTVALTADLDLAGINWTSIGHYSSSTSIRAFSGTFDGRNHTIKNVTVNTTTSSRASLFGYLLNGTIKNLTIYNPVATSTNGNVGGVVGRVHGTVVNGSLISNCHVIGGSLSTTVNTAGGIVGYADSVSSSVVQGITIEDCSVKGDPAKNYEPTVITSANYTGGIVGAARGYLAYTRNVNGTESAGIYITRCATTATVIAKTSFCGGIGGWVGGSIIDQCYTTGAVFATGSYPGGIVGYMGTIDSTTYLACKVSNCLATGDMLSGGGTTSAYAGGIVAGIGAAAGSYVEDCIFTGNVTTRSANSTGSGGASGIIGINFNSTANVGGCVSASDHLFGLGCSGGTIWVSAPIASGWTGNIYPTLIAGKQNFYNKDVLLGPQKGLTPAATNRVSGNGVSLDTLKSYSTYVTLGWDLNDVWGMMGGFNDGFPYLRALGVPEQPLGSRYNPIPISSPADFKEMSDNVNSGKNLYAGKYLKQTADLDMTGIGRTGSTYALSFRGNYDGGEYSMTNVNLTVTTATVALFGYVVGATFRNMIIEKPVVYSTATSGSCVGVIVGESTGGLIMDNCAVIGGSVMAQKLTSVGALAGYVIYAANYITNCLSSATVDGGGRTGGIVGYAEGTAISKCYAVGNVTSSLSSGYDAGGIVGETTSLGYYEYSETATAYTACEYNQSHVTNCYAKCDVTDSHTANYAFVGGIVGRAIGRTTVSYCYYVGTLSAISGYSSTSAYGAFASGIIGCTTVNTSYVQNCLSVPTFGEMTSKGKWLEAAYYNTWYSTAAADSVGCYHVETTFPTLKGGNNVINTGTAVTLDHVTDGTVFAADKLGWDMNDVWSHDPQVNGGFPILRGLIVDTSDLLEVLNKAKTYKQSDWSSDTYSALSIAIANAESDIKGKITELQKDKDIVALQTAMEGLRADKFEFGIFYNKIISDYSPYKDNYLNYSVVESLLKGAEEIMNDNSNRFRNSDIIMVYNALQTAVNNLRIDRSELNNAIEAANALKASDYSEDEFKKIQEKLYAAVAVYNNDNATAAEVVAATEALNNALNTLQIDKTQIAEEIIAAYGYIGVKAIYNRDVNVIAVQDSSNKIADIKFVNYDAFDTALNTALRVQADDNATSREIQDAMFDLTVTLNALTLDKKPLQTLYYTATAINSDYYTQESVAKLAQPIKDVETALQYLVFKENFVEMSKIYDTAYSNLEAALGGLELNKTELKQMIDRASDESKVGGIYTDETWEDLQTVLAKAQAVYENSAATQEDIHGAIVDLNEAIQNLELNLQYLKDLISDADKILSDDTYSEFYLGDSLRDLQSAKDKAQGVIDNYDSYATDAAKIAAVKDAARDLQDALDALKVDLSQLEDYIDRVVNKNNKNYIDPDVYAAENIVALTALAKETQELLDGNDYSDEQVIVYTHRFEALFDELKPNKDPLTALVREVSTWTNTKYRQDNDGKWILDDNGNMKVFVIYLADTWTVMQSALKSANLVLLDNDATVDDVVNAKKALENGILGLIVDTSELEERMVKAEGLLEKKELYTALTYSDLQTKYQAAENLLASNNKLVLDDVQKCLDELVAAINGLQVSKEYLLELIEQAEALSDYEDYFTESSYSAMQTQLKYVKENVDKDLDEYDITFLNGLLSDAIDGLVIVTDELEGLIDRFDDLEEQFVTKSVYDLVSGLAKDARDMLSGEFTVQEYCELVTAFSNALDLVTPDIDAFKEFIDECSQKVSTSYTDESVESLTEQIDNARHVYNGEEWNDETGKYETVEITYDDVIASVEALRNAVLGLQPKKNDLQDLVDQTKDKMDEVIDDFGEDKKVSECYTAESYDDLDEALQNGYLVLADESASLDDVNNAIAQIKAAIEALVIDKTPLQALIKVCDELYLEEYFEEAGFTVFKAKLTQSKADVEDDDISLDDFIASYNNLLQAKEALVFSTDALEKIIAVAEGKEQANYTVGSFQELTKDLQAAKDYLDSEDKDSDTYNEVCGNLLEAIGELVSIVDLVKEIDAVQEFVDKGNELDTENGVYYSDGSFKAVEDLVAEANILKNLPDPTQAEVDDMIARLKDYQSLLFNVFDAKQFSNDQHDFIDENEGEYSDRTWSAYTDALDELDSLLAKAKDEVTLEDLDKAMDAVTEAKEALKLASEDTDDDDETESGLFEVIETNNSFKFIHGDGEVLDFSQHEYDPEAPVYLTDIAAGDTLADIIAQFKNKDITVYDAEGAEITDLTQVVATGIVLEIIENGEVVDTLTLVLHGDLNGDGEIDVFDKAILNAFVEGTITLDVDFKLAANIKDDEEIDVFDKATLNAYVEGTIDLFDGLSVRGGAV